MTVRDESEVLQVEVPKEVVEEANGHVTVIATPTSEETARRFEEWVWASGGPGDMWMLVNTETGEVEEGYHVA